jgi:hypothetical protein
MSLRAHSNSECALNFYPFTNHLHGQNPDAANVVHTISKKNKT